MKKIIPVIAAAMLTTSLFARSTCAAALPDILDNVSSPATDVPDGPKHQSPM